MAAYSGAGRAVPTTAETACISLDIRPPRTRRSRFGQPNRRRVRAIYPRVLWLRKHAVVVVAVSGTAALVTLAVLAMTGSVLSRVHEIEGQRGGTLTVVSLEGSPDLDPARINDVYGTMIARAVDLTPYTFRPDREGPQPDLAEGTPEISDDSRQVTITIRSGVHFSPPVNREVTSRDVAYGIARGFLPGVGSPAAQLYFADVKGVAAVAAGRRTLPSGGRAPAPPTPEIHPPPPTP